MMKKYCLLCLLPPSHIEKKVSEAQEILFHAFGLTSCMAFPPHIPLAYYEPVKKEIKSRRIRCHLRFTEIIPFAKSLFYAPEHPEALKHLINDAGIVRFLPEFLPVGRGIYIGNNEKNIILKELREVTGNKADFLLSGGHLGTLKFTTVQEPEWWINLQWEIV